MRMRISFTVLFLFSLVCNRASAEWESPAVQDTNGNPVVYGQRYAILPVLRGFGGGVTIGSARGNSSCSGVVQDRLELSIGTPVVFLPYNSTKRNDFVRMSTDMHIRFVRGVAKCPSSSWKVDWDDTERRMFIVTTKGNGGLFKIDQDGNNYLIYVCPTVCNTCRPYCGEVGIYVDEGVRRLGLRYETFRVQFKKM